jgi:hypothetical protein
MPDKNYVAFFVTSRKTMAEVMIKNASTVTAHLRAQTSCIRRDLCLWQGPFWTIQMNRSAPWVSFLRGKREEYAKGDPFVLNGLVAKWYIREWANILK